MTAISLLFLLLSLFLDAVRSTEIDIDGVTTGNIRGSGSLGDVQILVQEEEQVMNALMELDTQLNHALHQASSASGDVEIDVIVGDSDGSSLWIDDEIVVMVPAGSKFSDEEKESIKEEIENEVAGTLDEMIVGEAVELPEVERGGDKVEGLLADKVERLFEEEAEAEKELEQMQSELKAALDNLPSDGGPAEIDVVISEANDDSEVEVIDGEIVVAIPASSGSGPRLSEKEKEELEEEVGVEAADALGTIVMKDFVGDEEDDTGAPEVTEKIDLLPAAPRLEEDSPQENTLRSHPGNAVQSTRDESETEPKPALREAVATAIAQPGFDHPMFVPRHWQMPPDEQLWSMKLSMLTSISCMTMLLIVGVWTGVHRSRRRAVIDDSHFRWAEAVEYMDAFPYDA